MRKRTPEQLKIIVEKMQELMTERAVLADTSIRARVDGTYVSRKIAVGRIHVIDRKLEWHRHRVPANMHPEAVKALWAEKKARHEVTEATEAKAEADAIDQAADQAIADAVAAAEAEKNPDTDVPQTLEDAAPDRFLPGVPGPDIERILDAAPGKELEAKFDRPTSSAALTVNAFGFFLHRPADIPPLPGLEHAGWPARSLALERTIRFPWTGGRHPVPDCLVATGSALVAIECKRFEPFRGSDHTGFSDTFWRPVWGDRMVGYQHVRDLLRGNKDLNAFLDAAQLVKHALALRATVQSQKEYHGLAPVLLYIYAEPDVWPGTGRRVHDDAKARHRKEIASFANHVKGDEVAFSACSYRQLLDAWRRGSDPGIARHAAAVIDRFAP